jgi:hypothetical protein
VSDLPRNPHATPWDELRASFAFTPAEEQQIADRADRMRAEADDARLAEIRDRLAAARLCPAASAATADREHSWVLGQFSHLRHCASCGTSETCLPQVGSDADARFLLARVDQFTAERDEALREAEEERLALLHQPVLRHCVYPGCLREFDAAASMDGRPVRASWSSAGWLRVTTLGGHICPDHAGIVAEDVHRPHWQHDHPSHLACACGWDSGPVRWRGYGVEAWKDHVLPEVATDA